MLLVDIPRQASFAVRQAIELSASCSNAQSIQQFAVITERFIMMAVLVETGYFDKLLASSSSLSLDWLISYIISDSV
jgi:hypothetical protein